MTSAEELLLCGVRALAPAAALLEAARLLGMRSVSDMTSLPERDCAAAD